MEFNDQDLAFVMHDLARLMRVRFDQHARTWGMTRAQCVILMKLSCRPGLSQAELAALMEVEPITVGRLIDRLEAAGFVERRPDPADRRMHRLHLLDAAKPLIAKVDAYRAAGIAQFREGICDEDWNTALKVLLRIKDTLLSESANSVVASAASAAAASGE
jgi:MarR family transcriptional regulator, transcriptional regulator for hemolysin